MWFLKSKNNLGSPDQRLSALHRQMTDLALAVSNKEDRASLMKLVGQVVSHSGSLLAADVAENNRAIGVEIDGPD